MKLLSVLLVLVASVMASAVPWNAADHAELQRLQDEFFATATDAGARIPLYSGIEPADFSHDVSHEEAQQAAELVDKLDELAHSG